MFTKSNTKSNVLHAHTTTQEPHVPEVKILQEASRSSNLRSQALPQNSTQVVAESTITQPPPLETPNNRVVATYRAILTRGAGGSRYLRSDASTAPNRAVKKSFESTQWTPGELRAKIRENIDHLAPLPQKSPPLRCAPPKPTHHHTPAPISVQVPSSSPREKFTHPRTARTIPLATQTQQRSPALDPPPYPNRTALYDTKQPLRSIPKDPAEDYSSDAIYGKNIQKNLSAQQKIKFGAIRSYVIQGIESIPVRVEVSIVTGLAKLEIIGLPDMAIKESKERIVKSLLSNGYKVPPGNITVNLASAKIRKRGTLYDLPIILGILIASKQIYTPPNLDQFIIAGELSLEGNLRRIEGLFTTVLEHIERNERHVYLIPHENESDIRSILRFKHVSFFSVSTLKEAITTLQEQKQIEKLALTDNLSSKPRQKLSYTTHETRPRDFKEVTGHSMGKLALQLAAINRLNVLFVGPPGSGKSMLMHRVPSILPKLSFENSLMVNRIYKAYNDTEETLLTEQPFRMVHSTINQTSLIGGGRYPKPGEISLSHKGFLFLDELSEFDRTTLQSLRTPLDMKLVTISRVEQQVVFPCDFTLLACTNPCSCGYYGDPIKRCVCTRGAVSRFYSKLSGPLVDRFDIMIYVSKIDEKDFTEQQPLSSRTMRENVEKASERRGSFKPLYQTATLKEIFKTNELARGIIQKALTKEIISIRRVNSVFKIVYALELFYGRTMDKTIVMQALELARNKLEI